VEGTYAIEAGSRPMRWVIKWLSAM